MGEAVVIETRCRHVMNGFDLWERSWRLMSEEPRKLLGYPPRRDEAGRSPFTLGLLQAQAMTNIQTYRYLVGSSPYGSLFGSLFGF